MQKGPQKQKHAFRTSSSYVRVTSSLPLGCRLRSIGFARSLQKQTEAKIFRVERDSNIADREIHERPGQRPGRQAAPRSGDTCGQDPLSPCAIREICKVVERNRKKKRKKEGKKESNEGKNARQGMEHSRHERTRKEQGQEPELEVKCRERHTSAEAAAESFCLQLFGAESGSGSSLFEPSRRGAVRRERAQL